MQATNKPLFFAVSGALLIAGLFFVERKPSEQTEEIKPSQMNFSESNKIKDSTTATEDKNSAVLQAQVPTQTAALTKFEATVAKLQSQDLATWQTFENILKSKNDNDPRLDTDLKHLSPEVKNALFDKYDTIPNEVRNDRGLIAYLIARDFQTPADVQFLKKVFEEPPCLSLADCKTVGPDDAHHSGTNQTTLNYPQLASLYQIEKRLTDQPEILKNPAMRSEILSSLRQAESFAVPVVQQKAQEIRSKFQL